MQQEIIFFFDITDQNIISMVHYHEIDESTEQERCTYEQKTFINTPSNTFTYKINLQKTHNLNFSV